jgi:hypothetical protein
VLMTTVRLTQPRLAQLNSVGEIRILQTGTKSPSGTGFAFYLYNINMGFMCQRELGGGGTSPPKSTKPDLPVVGEETEPDPSCQPGGFCDVGPGQGLLHQSPSILHSRPVGGLAPAV